jgi:hypothetical protein
MGTILELDAEKAKQYFLKQVSYASIELPPYFDFQGLLNKLSEHLEKNLLEDDSIKKAAQSEEVNYKILTNKDGRFAWRPIQLINPILYVHLVHKITYPQHWECIVDRFKSFQANDKIQCCSIPRMSEDETQSTKETTIFNWWKTIEQKSIEFSLNYAFLLCTDITDCYGSIYTHSIAWALHGKEKAKKNRGTDDRLVGNIIDKIIRSMSFGQTNGIPQGSTLMDFIAEIVLGYADQLLSKSIECIDIVDYKILRYRDDYRIFANNPRDIEMLAKLLTETLISLNMRLNVQKTYITDDIIQGSIKPDKLYMLASNKRGSTLQKTLLLIYSLSNKYPNSGSLIVLLSDFYKRIHKRKSFNRDNIKVLISILVAIMYKNPNTYPIVAAILSKLFYVLSQREEDCMESVLQSIKERFKSIPNVGHLMIWLQRLTIKINLREIYEEPLCKKVYRPEIDIWKNDWINAEKVDQEIRAIFKNNPIVDQHRIKEMDPIIPYREVLLFNSNNYNNFAE